MKHTAIPTYRKATNGQFTTAKYAKQNPRTTEKEIIYKPSPKKG